MFDVPDTLYGWYLRMGVGTHWFPFILFEVHNKNLLMVVSINDLPPNKGLWSEIFPVTIISFTGYSAASDMLMQG